MKDFATLPNTVGAFPDVASVDDPTGVGVLGTPWIAALIDEWFGAYQSVLDRAGLLPNALDEVHDNSQITQGLAKEHSEQTIRPDSPLLDITRGSWYNDTMSTVPTNANYCAIGTGAEMFVDLGVYFPAGVKTILGLDATSSQVILYDPVTAAVKSSSGALGGLGAGVWTLDAMCNDNDYAYVMAHDATAPPVHKIQAYSLSTWAVKAGWPATGTVLAAGVALPSALEFRDRVIFANDTTLACLNSWVAATGAATHVIETIDVATGAVSAFGAGDIAGGANYRASGRNLCSDGTNLYYTTHEVGGGALSAQVCSATIANPQIGCGGAGWPVGAAVGAMRWTVTTDGSRVYMFLHNTTTNYITMRVGGSTDSSVFIGDLISSSSNGYTYPHQATFDGRSIWLICWSTSAGYNDGAGNYVPFAVRIDPGLAMWSDADPGTAICGKMIDRVVGLGWYPYPAYQTCATLFDGRDFWFAPDPSAGVSGYAWRIPRVMAR